MGRALLRGVSAYETIEAKHPGDSLEARLTRGQAWLAAVKAGAMSKFDASLAKTTIIGWGDLCSDKDRAKYYSLASKFSR